MRILADEDVEYPIVERLRAEGHVVESIMEQARGTLDLPILARAVAEDLVLLTADHDFGEYIFRDGAEAPQAGVILYRLADALGTAGKADIIAEALRLYADRFAGHFVVIDEHNVRFRPLPA